MTPILSGWGGSSDSCTFGLTSGTATVSVALDYYGSEADVTITSPSGSVTTWDTSSAGIGYPDYYNWAGDIATLTELSTFTTAAPATSPAGTSLDLSLIHI